MLLCIKKNHLEKANDNRCWHNMVLFEAIEKLMQYLLRCTVSTDIALIKLTKWSVEVTKERSNDLSFLLVDNKLVA